MADQEDHTLKEKIQLDRPHLHDHKAMLKKLKAHIAKLQKKATRERS